MSIQVSDMQKTSRYTLCLLAASEQSDGVHFHNEPDDPDTSIYQRDRERILQSTALCRLKHKTQLFVCHKDGHYRTWLTHSLEVAQIARSIARTLGLCEDLTEALALVHDLGHTPFGLAGEEALDACMHPWGGFDHSAQAFRTVTALECRYAQFDGLNLSRETLEGLIKHNGPITDANGAPIGRYARTGIPAAFARFEHIDTFMLDKFASIEAQVAAISDDIVYNAHDIEDGLKAGLFDVIDLADIPLAGTALNEVLGLYRDMERSRMGHEIARRVVLAMVSDVIGETRKRVGRHKMKSPQEVRGLDDFLVAFSPQTTEHNRVLRQFLFRRMHRHEAAVRITERAGRIVSDLFNAYLTDPTALPGASVKPHESDENSESKHQLICDLIAGMTDRFAFEEHKRLFDHAPLFR